MKNIRIIKIIFIAFIFAWSMFFSGFPNQQEDPWESVILEFEKQDNLNTPPRNAVLFIGSSSIRLWKTLPEDFPEIPVINRGFGGSQYQDLAKYANRIVIPYKPRLIIVYSGDNDIKNRKSPQETYQDFTSFVELVRDNLPNVKFGIICIKPSIQRWSLVDKMRETNKLIQAYCKQNNFIEYIDVDTPMLGKDGKPNSELFIEDGLHLNRNGYLLWKEQVLPVIRDQLK
jgi:lysophospholipase L1-like esterase